MLREPFFKIRLVDPQDRPPNIKCMVIAFSEDRLVKKSAAGAHTNPIGIFVLSGFEPELGIKILDPK